MTGSGQAARVRALAGADGTRVGAVMAAIRQRIAGRMLAPGARLPSLRTLAGTMAVSKSTVVEAYDRLAAEGVIEARRGSGFYVAGHAPPLWRRADGRVATVADQIANLPLGVDCRVRYEKQTISLAPGESLLIFTDGVPDAMNAAGQFYGMDRLIQTVAAAPPAVEDLIETVVDDLHRFVGQHPPTDDICMTCFGRVNQA